MNGEEEGEGGSTSADSEPEHGYTTKAMQGSGKWTEGGATSNGNYNWKAVRKGGGKGGKSGTRKMDPNKGFLNQGR